MGGPSFVRFVFSSRVLGCQSTENAKAVRVVEDPLQWSVLESALECGTSFV